MEANPVEIIECTVFIRHGDRRFFGGRDDDFRMWVSEFKSFLKAEGLLEYLEEEEPTEEQKCAIMSRLYFCLTKETLRMLWQHFKYTSFDETKLDDGIMALQVMREYYLREFYQKHSVAEGIKEVRPRWCGKCVNRSHDTQRCGEYSLYRTGELGWDKEDWYYNAPGRLQMVKK